MKRQYEIVVLVAGGMITACTQAVVPSDAAPPPVAAKDQTESATIANKIQKTDAEWKSELTPEQYYVLREQGTERAFTGAYYDTKTPGVYLCAGCGQKLFDSDAKFDSGTGWPSYWQPIDENAVETEKETSLGVLPPEVHCSRCGGHLGHVFRGGPQPTGLRFCINSVSLELKPDESP